VDLPPKTVRLILLLTVCFLSGAAKNSHNRARVSGVVVDQTGAVITGASVSLLSLDRVREAITDESGQFEFSDLPLGSHDVRATHQWFKPESIEGVHLGGGEVQKLSITLQLGSAGCNFVSTANYEKRTGRVDLIGAVADHWDGPVDHATVTATSLGSARRHVVTTGKNGGFQFAGLERGKYILKVSHERYIEQPGINFWITRANLTMLTPIYILQKNEQRVIICE
jgi:hypothetical protein